MSFTKFWTRFFRLLSSCRMESAVAREYPDRLTIRVLSDEIADGQKGDCGTCPLALAVRRDYPELLRSDKEPEFEILEVYGDRLLVGDVCYQLPAYASYFIGHFDRGLHVEPATFIAWKIRPDRLPKNKQKIA